MKTKKYAIVRKVVEIIEVSEAEVQEITCHDIVDDIDWNVAAVNKSMHEEGKVIDSMLDYIEDITDKKEA